VRAAFGETFEAVGETFGAVTCLGNSFPHVLTDEDARRAAEDFARLVRPGGVLIIQQLNYEAMRLRDERFMGPQSRMIGECENLFLRVFDLDRDPIRFTMLRMEREPGGWTRHESVTEHRAWTGAEMNDLLGAAGFASVECLGDFRASPLEPATRDQMIVVAGR
jgi:SAM-dependent methyltransferase